MITRQDATGRYNYRLYALRKDKGLSLKQLGETLGYHYETVWRIERGLNGGKLNFWRDVQTFFNVPDADMWALQTGGRDEKGDNNT